VLLEGLTTETDANKVSQLDPDGAFLSAIIWLVGQPQTLSLQPFTRLLYLRDENKMTNLPTHTHIPQLQYIFSEQVRIC
jgi:hypothetical protein